MMEVSSHTGVFLIRVSIRLVFHHKMLQQLSKEKSTEMPIMYSILLFYEVYIKVFTIISYYVANLWRIIRSSHLPLLVRPLSLPILG
ncbi:hypothetical protein Back11_54400 [Paenibacillus baekrokdamisoli]|uniref:Uncharacterized protein n=1 Tax=Paenibacillus baekrokdamisoli TaxID=1712516 RepID=A0A3G9J711_9BACL|nr:hypothetical protein Back11_54400 [Paenibacillus baekrokdamisoli]